MTSRRDPHPSLPARRVGAPEEILQRAVDQLHDLGEKAAIELRILPGKGTGKRSTHGLRLTPGGAHLHAGAEKASDAPPSLVVIATADAFQGMADGTYSPVQA